MLFAKPVVGPREPPDADAAKCWRTIALIADDSQCGFMHSSFRPTRAGQPHGAAPRVTLQKFLSPMRHHLPSRACGAVERDLVFEALERDGADRLERYPIAVPLLLYLLAYENFVGPGVVRDS